MTKSKHPKRKEQVVVSGLHPSLVFEVETCKAP
jgi:hypothetical protein